MSRENAIYCTYNFCSCANALCWSMVDSQVSDVFAAEPSVAAVAAWVSMPAVSVGAEIGERQFGQFTSYRPASRPFSVSLSKHEL